jgi:hypothetical protein
LLVQAEVVKHHSDVQQFGVEAPAAVCPFGGIGSSSRGLRPSSLLLTT